jgi:hypothetical protein
MEKSGKAAFNAGLDGSEGCLEVRENDSRSSEYQSLRQFKFRALN